MKSRDGFRWALLEPTRFPWEQRHNDAHVFSSTPMPRGVTTLAAQLIEAGYTNGRVFCEALGPIDWDYLGGCDAVGIGVISCTAFQSYQVAAQLESMGIRVVAGGQEPTYRPDIALEYAGAVVQGEGDLALTEVFDAWRCGRSLEGILGVVYKEGTQVVTNPRRPWVKNLDRLPFPCYEPRILAHAEQMRILPVHGMRGCNRGCLFCSECRFWGPPRANSVEYVMAEIRANLRPHHRMIFLTANNAGLKIKGHPNWLEELADRLIAARNKVPIICQTEADLALKKVGDQVTDKPNDELLHQLFLAGFRIFCVGFENPLSQEALDQMGKKQQAKLYAAACWAFRRHGLRIHAMTFTGMKGDGPETATLIAQTMIKWRVFSFQAMTLTYLVGSALYNRVLEGKVKLLGPTNDPLTDSIYDTGHYARFSPEDMTALELQEGSLEAMRIFYSRWELFKSTLPSLDKARMFFRELLFQGILSPRGWVRATVSSWFGAVIQIRARRIIRAFEQSPATQRYLAMLRARERVSEE